MFITLEDKQKLLYQYVNGEQKRNQLMLDKLDIIDEVIYVKIPNSIIAISASYFSGCFSKSIHLFGEEKFRKKYVFICDDIYFNFIEDGIASSLMH
jgi:hypothetical protein